MDTELFIQTILNRVFNSDALNVTRVSGSSTSTNGDTQLKPQAILNRVFSNNTIRVIKV